MANRVIVLMACIATACGSKPPPKTGETVTASSDGCTDVTIESNRSVARFAHSGSSIGFELQSPGRKEKIAILGLEVVSSAGRKPDAEDVRVAQDLTVALRLRPKAQQGPYLFTPASEKELVDVKVIGACESEAADCMTKIGKELGTDVLLYGRIERRSQAGSAGYQVSLTLLNIENQAYQRWTDFIPIGDTQSAAKLGDWARKGYKKLTNDADGGTLVVILKNGERGTILIDGEERGIITNNRGEVTGLAEGRYKLAVIAGSLCRWDAPEPITIRNGETVTETVLMKARR
jgi:hypothetical protein